MTEIAFIDRDLPDWQDLAAGVRDGVEVVFLERDRDGLAQIAEALRARSNLDAIHVFSHGGIGALYLGSARLDASGIAAYADALASMGRSLGVAGDILLYGCDIGQGQAGRAFLEALTAATGADVAASVDRTGSRLLGGDWDPELRIGQIDAGSALVRASAEDYGYALATFNGTAGDDALEGTPNADVISGLGGDDRLDGKGGNDTLDGGPGNDSLIGGIGDDVVHGGDGHDTIFAEGTYGNDRLFGDAGDDYFWETIGNDVLDGGDGDDFFRVEYNNFKVFATGGAGRDTYAVGRVPSSSNYHDYRVTDFASGPGGDLILVQDLLDASALHGYTGGNPFAKGFLRLVHSGANALLQWDRDGTGASHPWITMLTLSNFDAKALTAENFVGGIPPDGSSVPGRTINGNEWDDTLTGAVFDDQINGLEGNDKLDGRGGDDTLNGGAGNDTISGGLGIDTVFGGVGSDTFTFSVPPASSSRMLLMDFEPGADLIDAYSLLGISATLGYAGVNPFSAAAGYLRLVQDQANTLLQWDRDGAAGGVYRWATVLGLQNIDRSALTDASFIGRIPPDGVAAPSLSIDGTTGADVLIGGISGDRINGLEGDDRIYGQWGGDTIDGGAGDDLLVGGPGNDLVIGGDGNDGFTFTTRADGFEDFESTRGNDTLVGGAGDDVFLDFRGNNVLDGGDGADVFVVDTRDSGNSETATGGAGRDTYDIAHSVGTARKYAVTDFAAGAGGDLIDVDGLLGISSGYVGGNPFRLGYLRLLQSGPDTLLQWDRDGPAGTDVFVTKLTLRNTARTSITSANFPGKILIGDDNDNTLRGGIGDDVIDGRGGSDAIDGNLGDDRIDGGTGNDTLKGDEGDDTLSAGSGDDWVEGGDGADTAQLLGRIEDYRITVLDGPGGGKSFFTLSALEPGDVVNLVSKDGRIDRLAGVERVVFLGDPSDSADDRAFSVSPQQLLAGAPVAIGTRYFADAANLGVVEGSSAGDMLDGLEGNDSLSGLAGNDWLDGGLGNDTMSGGLGNDIYMVDSQGDDVKEIAGQGLDTVRTALSSYTLPVNVERLEYTATSGDFTGTGNDSANTITGGAGNDTLDGGKGADTLIGGAGDDSYVIDRLGTSTVGADGSVVVVPGDVVKERDATGADTGGNDTIRSSLASLSLAGFANVEDLVYVASADGVLRNFAGTGSAGNNVLTGGTGNDTLFGGNGDDTLVGGAGSDTLNGGLGADIARFSGAKSDYSVSLLVGDIAQLAQGEAKDNLVGVERVVFDMGTAAADDDVTLGVLQPLDAASPGTTWLLYNVPTYKPDNLSGTAGNDTINGLEGNDTISAGAGADTVSGGAGDDVLNGDAGADTLNGNAGNDTLDGGLGDDTMLGGAGNDTYIVDSAADAITENVAQGNDLVRTALAAYTLPETQVERLEYTGTGSFTGTGNGLNNRITGGAGDDTLDGGGGADRMEGGAGNDTYVVDRLPDNSNPEAPIPGDTVVELLGGGTADTVRSIVNYTIGANVENLVLIEGRTINGTGNLLDNALTGNELNNLLSGGLGNDTLNGGAGSDTLRGGAGSDVFVFDNLASFDRIADFVGSSASSTAQANGVDRIQLNESALGELDWVNASLAEAQFQAVTNIADATAGMHLVYNSRTGELFYDADGFGAGNGEALVAILGTTTHPALVAADFMQG